MGMRFGQFGREDGALVLSTQGGALCVKILKRSVNFELKDINPSQSEFMRYGKARQESCIGEKFCIAGTF